MELAEIVSRWIVNQPQPGDLEKINQIVNFNSYISRLWCHDLAVQLFRTLHHKQPDTLLAKTKGELKDFIVENPLRTTPRIEELFARYRRWPEDFYRETPYDGRIYYLSEADRRHYVGSTRIKRFRRIAEKGARRIVDYMFERIRINADALAEERAKALGIPKRALITPPEQQVEEFLHAERRLLKMIRRGTIQYEFPILSIPDVVGIKILVEGDQYERLIDTIERSKTCTLLEQEQHTGRYNAINLRVAHQIPRDRLLQQLPARHHIRILKYRGFDPATVIDDYTRFVETAEDHVLLEIIVCSYDDFIESEIGRCMHEERITNQRSHIDYSGHLATNVMHLMDYILALCLAPTHGVEITDVPVKLWMRYMPDTLDRLQRKIFNVPVDASFEDPSTTTTTAVSLSRRALSDDADGDPELLN
ncbi:MAG: hypothetical protein H6707_04800 [Deltaproteobacteria bacterium]|nr:hypothetical protein [Deltaproteobacteria bacterium]